MIKKIYLYKKKNFRDRKENFFFLSKRIIMINLTTYELKLIAGEKGIKNYRNMSREKLLSTLDESEHILKDLSQNGLKQIAKMQNLSQNELKQITKMSNLLQNELEKIAKMRHIKNYKNMSREEFLIALLKSKQSIAELRKSKDNNAEIGVTKRIFNELRNNFSKEQIKKIRRKFSFREDIDKYLKELEKKDSLTEQEKREKKRYTKKLRKAEEFFKKLKEEDLNRLEKYQYNDNEDLEYKGIKQIENLFDEINEEDY